MSAIRLVLAVWIGKIIAWASRITGKKGSSLPGMVARRIYPRILTDLSNRLRNSRLVYTDDQGYVNTPGRIIAVTGTNGKTTVTHMLYDFIKVTGQKIIYNQEGANMINGVTTAFIACAGLFGKISSEYALLEVDEGSLPAVMAEITPDILVVTNFSSDQEDRYNAASAAEIVREALQDNKDTWLVLNADDPNTAVLAETTPSQSFFYGSAAGAQSVETLLCPKCSQKLRFDIDGYSGSYDCDCGLVRPEPDLKIIESAEPDAEGLRCRVRLATGQEYELRLPVQGSYNYYNMAAAFLTGICLGIKPNRMVYVFQSYRPSPGRMERLVYKNKTVLLNLVKNAKGYEETLPVCEYLPGGIVLLIAFNDTPADGRDIAWIWDVDFEKLSKQIDKYIKFFCTGPRGAEMAVRLKYAGIPQDNIMLIDDMRKAAKAALTGPGEHVVMLSSYSSLVPLRDILLTLTLKVEDSHAENMLSIS